MYKVTSYPHGTFSWADCISSDSDAGKDFYQQVMGWGTEDTPMGNDQFYTFFKQDGETVSAVGPMQAEMIKQGAPSYWANYVSVEDVDALVDKVTELGGTVIVPPMDVFDAGRMMVVQDPTGASLSLWQAKNHIGAYLVNQPGAMMWNELMTTDPQQAMDFYGALLGWEFQKMEDQDYHLILNKGRMNGGIFPLTDQMQGMPPMWTVYFNVEDLEETLEKTKAHGGAVHMQGNANGIGEFAFVADPQGASFYIMQASNADTWDAN